MNFAWARTLDDEKWKDELLSGSQAVPDMPPPDVQEMFVGTTGREAFHDPAIFWSLTRKIAADLDQPFNEKSRVLDVGVGWGRIYRWLLRDLTPSQVKGIDIDPSAIAMCKAVMPYGDFEHVPLGAPYPRPPEGYDLAYFFSVLSHLSEDNAKAVLATTRNALKSGGLVALTTLRAAHLDVWNSQWNHPRFAVLLKESGFNLRHWIDRAVDGEHLYMPTGGGDHTRPDEEYGEAVIPKGWFERLDGFRLITYRHELQTGLPQAYVVLKKN